MSLLLAAALFAQRGETPVTVSSSDLGFRMGSVEAKIDGLNKSLDEIKTAQKATDASVQALNVRVEGISTKLAIITGILVLIGTAVVTDLVQQWVKRPAGFAWQIEALLAALPPETRSRYQEFVQRYQMK